jgi:hypothetical protein
MMETNTPIIPNWFLDYDRFSRTLADDPNLIGWREIVRLSGDSTNTMEQRRQRGMFDLHTVGYKFVTEQGIPEAYYRRDEALAWLAALTGGREVAA